MEKTEKSEVYLLSKIAWQFWCSFTFRRVDITERLRRGAFFTLLRELAENFGVSFPRLLWSLRIEHGEQTGRLHYHALVGGLPEHGVTSRTAFAMKRRWERIEPLCEYFNGETGKRDFLSTRCGSARVFVFSQEFDTLSYFTKDGVGIVPRNGGDCYESRKFGQADQVLWSESCKRLIAARCKSRIVEHVAKDSKSVGLPMVASPYSVTEPGTVQTTVLSRVQ